MAESLPINEINGVNLAKTAENINNLEQRQYLQFGRNHVKYRTEQRHGRRKEDKKYEI